MQGLGCLSWASGNNFWHGEPSIGLWISASEGSALAGPGWVAGHCSWEGNWEPGEVGPRECESIPRQQGQWGGVEGSRRSVQLVSLKLDDSCPDWTGGRGTLCNEVKACSRWHSVWGTPRPLLVPDWMAVHVPPPPGEQDCCDLQHQDLWPDTPQRHG